MEKHARSNLGLDSTAIREKTYWELQSENYDLQNNYTNLEWEYKDYKNAHGYSNSEYNALNSTYNQYIGSHSYSNTEYSNLQSTLNRELSLYKNLNYIMIAIAVVFIASTIYFARKKPKVKTN